MKIRLTEAQIKMLKENYPQQGTGAVINALTDTNKTQTAVTNVNKLKTAIDTLKTSMKTENSQSSQRLELTDHIDELLHVNYGFTFFKDKSKPAVSYDDPKAPSLFPYKKSGTDVPFYPKLSPEQQAIYDKKLGGMYMDMLKSGDENELNKLFITLIRQQRPMREGDYVPYKAKDPETHDTIDEPGDEIISVEDYVDGLLQIHPNGLKLNTALQDIDAFSPISSAKLYRVLSDLVEKGKLTFDSGKPIEPDDLDYIVHTSYLGRSNMRKAQNVMFKTIPAPGLNETKLDFLLGKPIELKKTLHTIGKYDQSTNSMERLKKTSIIKGIIEDITQEKISRMVVKYKTEQGANGVAHIMYSKKEFIEAESTYHITYEGLSDKDSRMLELFKANYYDDTLTENNFADSEIFRIIAEAERPRLTKKEFIDYIKTKKK
jgi:hypothetical protein